MSSHPLLFFACLELLVSLALAWLGVATLHLRLAPLTRFFPRPMYIIRAHIDFLLMALLLIAFHLLGYAYPGWIIVCAIIGSITNASLFIVMAAQQQRDIKAFEPMGMLSTASFTITTLGFGGLAVSVLMAL